MCIRTYVHHLCTYIRMYVCTSYMYIRMYVHHICTYVRTSYMYVCTYEYNNTLQIACTICFGTSMICSKHRFAIIYMYVYMNAFSYTLLNFRKEDMLDKHPLKYPGRTLIHTYVCTVHNVHISIMVMAACSNKGNTSSCAYLRAVGDSHTR